MSRRLAGELLVAGEPLILGEQGLTRLEAAHLRHQLVPFLLRDVGRVGDDDVEALRRQLSQVPLLPGYPVSKPV